MWLNNEISSWKQNKAAPWFFKNWETINDQPKMWGKNTSHYAFWKIRARQTSTTKMCCLFPCQNSGQPKKKKRLAFKDALAPIPCKITCKKNGFSGEITNRFNHNSQHVRRNQLDITSCVRLVSFESIPVWYFFPNRSLLSSSSLQHSAIKIWS